MSIRFNVPLLLSLFFFILAGIAGGGAAAIPIAGTELSF